MILEEFDPNKEAVINPGGIINVIDGFPEVVVSCFSRVTFDRILSNYNPQQIASVSFANLVIPVYKIEYRDTEIGLVNAYVGAAGSVGMFEDLTSMGMKKLLIFGTCGVLDARIKDTSIIIPNRAVRDEGTSYHYAPATDEIDTNVGMIAMLEDYFNRHDLSYTIGKVWTTDAFYRETRSKLERRKQAGCIAVDMECSALAAFAQFRGIELIHFFYAADNLDTEVWDARSLSNHHRLDEKDAIASIALDIAYSVF
ncbi:MAG: nucleoside phosphorylase [Erysipelothrix sp.]|nr:nucleoside phosphorylase [Erysipelothrix sp.]